MYSPFHFIPATHCNIGAINPPSNGNLVVVNYPVGNLVPINEVRKKTRSNCMVIQMTDFDEGTFRLLSGLGIRVLERDKIRLRLYKGEGFSSL